ncbi:GntR family transcriptional regulator [Gluconacetobacter takamatsuzukensis]|uniref:GntR family transcriptional regulator n=1 Tax=Gluconacetobacter takamatsuzukensis TaxID=1286190 RepID=A0A7W4KG68_9PROT|nr:GntR family transcriptional regulator [Gluconacetobacter takamatsuzukensis]MBB2206382.1 GntR family transcriptional regulator [Gluconacetobacter takamatsuzukensis]
MTTTSLTTEIGTSIPENLARLIGADITFGRLAAWTRLTEEQVANTYNVSRSPVREAIRLLERDGLIARSSRRGIWVAPLSLKDFDGVYACRIALEALAAEQAARSPHAASTRPAFDRLLTRLRTTLANGDTVGFFEADVEGSEIIYDLADNPTLRRLLLSLEKQALRYRYFAYQHSAEVTALSVNATRDIYARICEGDHARARALTETLIKDIWQSTREVLADFFSEKMP